MTSGHPELILTDAERGFFVPGLAQGRTQIGVSSQASRERDAPGPGRQPGAAALCGGTAEVRAASAVIRAARRVSAGTLAGRKRARGQRFGCGIMTR